VCGIAGYSLHPESGVDRTLAAQVLLAGIAERGADAAGYAFAGPSGAASVFKLRAGASALLEALVLPGDVGGALIHVRDHTKGHPSFEANNHPIRHGAVVGIHNGTISNDDELLARHHIAREQPEATVDSEAIFALVDRYGHRCGAVLEQLRGSMAAAWLDEREPRALYAARGADRPLWIGRGKREFFFASTREALELVWRYAGVALRLSEVPEGRLLGVVDGKLELADRFQPARDGERRSPVPVKAPEERRRCLARLATLAA
jgi:glucosamine 6-phosphate synthetase-like amidotransferase/phosphosugar isomerase protein